MKISTSVHVRGWAIYDLEKRFNIAIHLLNLQSRNFILNIRIRKFKLYLSVRHPVLKSLSGDWTDVIINTLCYQFLILFLFERPLSERRKDGFPNCMGPGKCSSFPFFQFCFLSNHNGPDLIVPLFKAFTSQISFLRNLFLATRQDCFCFAESSCLLLDNWSQLRNLYSLSWLDRRLRELDH